MVAVEDQHHRCIREVTDASDAHTINTTENITEPPALKYEDEEPEITFVLPAGDWCVLIDGRRAVGRLGRHGRRRDVRRRRGRRVVTWILAPP